MKSIRGQFFTVHPTVQKQLVDLLTPVPEDWRILEPSAGAGDLVRAVLHRYPEANITGWELDEKVATPDLPITIGDFFTKADHVQHKFHSILGNPPYVAWKHVEAETQQNAAAVKAAYSDKANLYYLFMDRCIDLLEDDGELIFIQPKEWMYSTSAAPIREKMLATGTITHIIDGNEEKVFPDANVPAIMIFRYQKTKTEHHTVAFRHGLLHNVTPWEQRRLSVTEHGYWMLFPEEQASHIAQWTPLREFFSVRVGIITGADTVFNVTKHPDLQAFIAEGTAIPYRTTRGIEYYLDVHEYQRFDSIPERTRHYLLCHEETLLARRITRFDASNWWKYGAVRNKRLMESSPQRIYTYQRTRSTTPFFLDDRAQYFTGSLLALFPHDPEIDLQAAVDFLNSSEFREMCSGFGLTTANKVTFQPKTLGSIPIPDFRG